MGMTGPDGDNGHGMMSEINVTPFVDVMLVLLIIFMVTTPLMTTGMNVELPRTDAPPLPQAEKQMVLSITAEGGYYIDQYEFSIEELGPKLAKIVQANPEQEVFLKADASVPYEKVAQLVALCTNAGVPKLGLVTQPGKSD